MSRFPKLTETFILYEMLAVEARGAEVEVYPLHRQGGPMHPEAAALVERAHFAPLLSARVWIANFFALVSRPRTYLGALGVLLVKNWGSRRYFVGALALFPKAVYFAGRMRRDGITHIHAHFASHPAAAAFVAHRLTGIPYSFTAHGSDLHRDRHMLREKVAEAAFVVCISRYNREVVLAECGAESGDKVEVIHCGVDTRVFHPGPVAAGPGSNGRRPLAILCVGTLHPVKGQTVLIEACRRLHAAGVPLIVDLVGDGPDRAALAHQAQEAGLEQAVHFHGRLTRAEVAHLLRQADVVAAPSVPTPDGRREGIPVALMEAMASGVPVVASRLSGIPELVEDGRSGLLFPPGDAGALAGAIARLHADPGLRRRLSGAGLTKVTEEFELSTSAATIIERVRQVGAQGASEHSAPAMGLTCGADSR